jgi:hypothetical protein
MQAQRRTMGASRDPFLRAWKARSRRSREAVEPAISCARSREPGRLAHAGARNRSSKCRSRSVSRILSPAERTRPGNGHSSSPAITDGIKRPTRRHGAGRPHNASLFGLAPCGVLPATHVAAGAVRSYRTFSPLPLDSALRPRSGRYIFCATFLQVTLTGRYPAHCPAEFGLSSLPAGRLAPRRETATV